MGEIPKVPQRILYVYVPQFGRAYFYLKGAIFDVCLKSYWNKHVEFYVHEPEIEKSGILGD